MMDIRQNEILNICNIKRYVIKNNDSYKSYISSSLCVINGCKDCIFNKHRFDPRWYSCLFERYFKTRICNKIIIDSASRASKIINNIKSILNDKIKTI